MSLDGSRRLPVSGLDEFISSLSTRTIDSAYAWFMSRDEDDPNSPVMFITTL